MRVLFLTEERISFSEPLVRGGAIHVRNVVEGLSDRGHEPFLVDWNADPERPFQRSVDPRSRFVDGPLRTTRRAIHVGRSESVDVVVSKTRKTYLPGLVAARRLGVPHVVHVGSSLDRPTGGALERVDQASLRVRLRAPHDAFFVVCDHIGDQLRDGGADAGRIFDVKNAVDAAKFHPTEIPVPLDPSHEDLLADPADDRFDLGYVGGLQPYKGLDDLGAALERVDGDVRVIVAGDGPERSRLEAVFGDAAVFLGAVPYEQVPALYHEFDAFVLPSHTEGLPRVVLEAQATATPVIATDVGCVASVVADGDTGLLCPPRDPRALADAIDELRTDGDRDRLGANGRETIVESFSWTAMYERYERFLARVVDRGP